MEANKRFKILLIQLPSPESIYQNIPLAGGYLKAMAYREGLLTEVDIEILGIRDTNLSSDSKLIDLIISKSPNVVAFSLYLWNSFRSIFIAEKVKNKLPDIKIVVGGPEVTLDTKYILDNPVVDIGCIGEGELTFVEIIKNFITGQKDYDYASINGIFYRESGKIVVTPPREPIKYLDEIPSPFILGFINLKDYNFITFETMRGCTFKCNYCVTGSTSRRYFSVARICEDLKVILKNGVGFVFFIDSDVLLHPNFCEICENVKEINNEKKLEFSAFTYAEHINKKKADLLKECNFKYLEIGLQSTNSTTLKNIQRPLLNRKKFITGLRLLEERKITYSVDIIIGLPNETIRDLRKTFKFIRDNEVRAIRPFTLNVLPGTRLRREVESYGIIYQKKPPYFLIEAPYISKDKIEEAINLFGKKPVPSFKDNFISYYNHQYPILQKKEELINFFNINQLNNIFNKVIIELNPSCQSINQLRIVGKRLSRMIYYPFTVWFKCQNVEECLHLIESFLSSIVRSNPFLICNIILETNNFFSLEAIERVKKSLCTKEKILSDFCHDPKALTICAIYHGKNCNGKKQWLSSLGEVIPFYWSLNISNENDLQGEIDCLFQERHSSGILIDFDPESKMDFIVEGLKALYKKNITHRKTLLFRNLAFDYIGFIVRQKNPTDIPIIKPGYIQSVLSLDKYIKTLSVLKPSNETVMDLIICQKRLQKFLKTKAITKS